jgi:hypothetical protein
VINRASRLNACPHSLDTVSAAATASAATSPNNINGACKPE